MTQVLRATFEAVFASQERLRNHLDLLAKENRGIKDEFERREFMKELSYATLGYGNEIIVNLRAPNTSGVYFRKDLETVMRWMAYQSGESVSVPMELHGEMEDQKENIPFHNVWSLLRDQLFTLFPIALKHSASMSREQEGSKKTQGYSVEDDPTV